jgi:hypothetical protein
LQEQTTNGYDKNNDVMLKNGRNGDGVEKEGQKDVGVQPQSSD